MTVVRGGKSYRVTVNNGPAEAPAQRTVRDYTKTALESACREAGMPIRKRTKKELFRQLQEARLLANADRF